MISGSFPDLPCGVSYHTWVVCTELAKQGRWDLHLLTSDHPSINGALHCDFRVHPLIRRWNLRAIPTVLRFVRRLAPDVVHLQYPTLPYNGRLNLTLHVLLPLLRSVCGVRRIVVTQHDFSIAHWLSRLRAASLLSFADGITVSNDRDETALRRYFPFLAKRVRRAHIASHLAPVTLSREERRSVRAETGIERSEFLLTYFGFIVPGRRLDVVLHALRLILDAGHAARLAVMGGPLGGDLSYLERLRGLADSLGLSERVNWLGHCPSDRVARILAASDLFVMPIQRGADLRSSTLAAAISQGVPIVTTRNRRYLIDRDLEAAGCVIFCDPNSSTSLARAILRGLSDRSLREELKRNMRRLVPRLDWKAHARAVAAQYV